MDILKFAMEKEEYSRKLYKDLADKTQNQGLQNIFHMLAEEETKHFQTIKDMKLHTPGQVTETDVIGDARNIFEKMKKGADFFDFDVAEADLYKKAREMEQESMDYYLQKAKEVDDEEKKQILELLAAEEKKHFDLLDNIVEFVDKPNHWLENAEFFHMGEY